MTKIALAGALLATVGMVGIDANSDAPTSDAPPKKRKAKRPTGVELAAKRLDAHRKATAKRLKNAPEDRELSRQVVRQMQRRAKKMPVALSQFMWHQANGFPTVGIRRAA
jgi:hypothetical protein